MVEQKFGALEAESLMGTELGIVFNPEVLGPGGGGRGVRGCPARSSLAGKLEMMLNW